MLTTGRLWLVICGGLILAYCLYLYNGLATRASNAETELASYKHAQAELVLKQQIEYKQKLIDAQNAINAEKEASLKLLQDLQIDRVQTAHKFKAQYDTKIANIKRNLANRASGVLPATTGDASTAIEVTSDAVESTESGRECDTAYSRLQAHYNTLEDACAITTSDFNQCRAWGDVVCSMAMCE